jgi:MbtH protein
MSEDTDVYTVVINDEEQYSIWRVGRDVPRGWREVGKTGPKAECLAYIDEVWTDMRPRNLREAMDADVAGSNSP